MICRRCGESNYSRVQRDRLKSTIYYLFPIKTYVCNVCGCRFHKNSAYTILATTTFFMLTIVLVGFSLALKSNTNDISSVNLKSQDNDGDVLDDQIKADKDDPFINYGSEKPEYIVMMETEQSQNENLKISKLVAEPRLQKITKIKTTEEQLIEYDFNRLMYANTNESSLVVKNDILTIDASDSPELLNLKQCFVNKKVILFDRDTLAFYDDDQMQDKISIQKGRILVYLSVSNIGVTDTVHHEYPIPDDYSGISHQFVFLDRNEDGKIDNKVYSYPKGRPFPLNLCKNNLESSKASLKITDNCTNIDGDKKLQLELNSDIESGINRIYSKHKNSYTIQLYAAMDMSEAANFIRKYNLKDESIIFPALVNEKIYFKVVTGNFSGIENARKELRKLPEKFKKLKPWIRKFSSFYMEISALASDNSKCLGV